jgi:hypothetical protein
MSATERHYTPQEIAKLWNMHPDTVRPLFRNVPGVLKIIRKSTSKKRSYVSLKIPESVMMRVHQSLSK